MKSIYQSSCLHTGTSVTSFSGLSRLKSRSRLFAAKALLLVPPMLIANPLSAQINCTASGKPCVLTGQYDNQRDAYNPNETTLVCSSQPCSLRLQQVLKSTGNAPSTMLLVDPSCPTCSNDLPQITVDNGASFYQATANPIYAQPLYVPGMTVRSPANTKNCGSSCNMLVAATLNGTVFAWNADTGAQLWSRQGNPNQSVANSNALWYDDCGGGTPGVTASTVPVGQHVGLSIGLEDVRGGPLQFIGTVSTPVIDTTNVPPGYAAVMYVTSFCQAYVNSTGQATDAWYMHEIDLSTGLDLCAGGSYDSNNQCGNGGTPQRIQVSSSSDPVTAPCSAGAAGCENGVIQFYGNEQNQRPALLEVSNPNLSPNHLVYVAFGAFANSLLSPSATYHGWLLSYTTDSQGYLSRANPQGSELQFNTSTKGPYPMGNTDQPVCDTPTPKDVYGEPFQFGSNICGAANTIWSSTRGIAATNYNDLSDNSFDLFFSAANGAFQYMDANGNILSSGHNFGNSLLRFQFSSENGMGLAPYQVFTPAGQQQFSWPGGVFTQNCGPIVQGFSPPNYTYTPCSPAIQPSQLNSRCPEACPSGTSSTTSCPCSYTVQVLNMNDWDMGTSGQMLFQDAKANWLLLTTDKGGFGYLVNPSDLCNGSGCVGKRAGGQANRTYSFSRGDAGNLFPFAAPQTLCQNNPGNNTKPGMSEDTDCDRVASMAFYNGRLYYWPTNIAPNNGERLTALQVSDWDTATPFSGTISSWTQNLGGLGDGSNDGQTQVAGLGTTFTKQVIAGDQLVACQCQAPNCPVITHVTDDTHLTLSALPTCAPASGLVSYAGYLINPARNANPVPASTGYGGGSLVIASSSLNSPDGVVFGISTTQKTASLSCDCSGGTCTKQCPSNGYTKTQGILSAYDATPNSSSTLTRLWDSARYNATTNPGGCGAAACPQTFCASSFALPTVANGRIYVPTYAINNDGTMNCPDFVPGTTSSYLSGILAYGKD